MVKIIVKELRLSEIIILQNEVQHFAEYISAQRIKEDFLNSIISLDISLKLWYLLRKKIEANKKLSNVSFNLSEAATIMKCCNYERAGRDNVDKISMLKISAQIDQQLKSMN